MKTSNFTLAFFLTVISAACGNYGTSATNAANSTTSKISLGVYDISSSSAKSAGDQNEVIATRSVSNTSGSGSGGRDDGREYNSKENIPAAQEISLDQSLKTQVAAERKIIRNAELNLEADSPEESQRKIAGVVESKGGFVVESQQTSSDVKTSTHDIVVMTVRVPAEKFGEALEEIRKTARRVIVETVKGEDVTEEFIDIEARLKAQKALEEQFMEIMKRADSVEDALSVQSQLADVRGEIEKVEGRMRFLENQASLSVIKIRLQTPTVFTANSAGISYRLTESFSAGFTFALNFVLGLLTLLIAVLPVALLIGFPGYLIISYFLKKRKRPMSVSEIAEDEIKSE